MDRLIDVPRNAKKCSKCKVVKSLDNFRRDKYHVDGLHSWCNSCSRSVGKQIYVRDKAKRNLSSKNSFLKRKYGIRLVDYYKMLANQNNRCAVCFKENAPGLRTVLVVDHSHSSGKIRGLLCQSCNRGLGLLGDSSERLLKLVEYLKKSGE